ncbi:MAG: MerR family transcriptional regulator [Desulfuromonadales bacterium]|nr:MerR family transcriptional regulator [Desulfuromonadales bacterium]MDW7757121.1 MerR family transcriptional regulator [Desulfuromonadales bacterium]
MSLVKTWYSPESAADKFGVGKAAVLEWVDEGLVRCEREGGKVSFVNIDDVRLQVEAMVRQQEK